MVRSENPAFIRLSDGTGPRQAQGRRRPAAARRPRRPTPTAQRDATPSRDRRRPNRPLDPRVAAGDRSVTSRRRPPAPAGRARRRRAACRPVAAAGPRPPTRPRAAAAPPAAVAARPAPPGPPAPAGRPGRRLRGAVVVLAFVLSLFGGRLVQLQAWTRRVRGRGRAGPAAHRRRCPPRAAPSPTATASRSRPRSAAVNITADQTLVVDPAATAAVLAPVLHDGRRRAADEAHRRRAGSSTWPRP